jgi:small nuclear ribonucleoprotein (snRNP)-like protein
LIAAFSVHTDTMAMDNRRPPCWRLDELLNNKVTVEMQGDRQVEGILNGFDDVGNIVLSDCREVVPLSGEVPEGYQPRQFGTAVLRSPHILAVNRAGDAPAY